MRPNLVYAILKDFAPFYTNGASCNVKQEFINYLLKYDLITETSEGCYARTITGEAALGAIAEGLYRDFPEGHTLPTSEDLWTSICPECKPASESNRSDK